MVKQVIIGHIRTPKFNIYTLPIDLFFLKSFAQNKVKGNNGSSFH